MLIARAVNARGTEVGLPEPVAWISSDTTVASVAPTGVVRGLRRGNAVITIQAGALSAEVMLRVKARVRIVPAFRFPIPSLSLLLAVGDSLQFLAQYVDVFGAPIGETPATTWTSSNAAGVSVSGSGLAVGLQAYASAAVIGSTDEGVDSARVHVGDAIAGLPAIIRFAHAVRGAGPVTFFPSKGTPVTLSFGESVERPVLSGLFRVRIAWLPDGNGGYSADYEDYPVIIRSGDRLELYAVKTPPGLAVGGEMILASLWARETRVPPDSGLVRFIQSSPFLVFDVRPPEAPASGNRTHCYFDPGDYTDYFPIGAGDFDLLLWDKSGINRNHPELARIRATAPSGRVVTYVILGETPETAGIMAFPDA
jgi:hypothetical protein